MSSEITKPQATSITPWDAELAKYAKEAAESEHLGGQFIGLQAGQFTIAGEPVRGNVLNVIVVDYIWENAYYPGKFDPKNKKPPVCFALTHNEDELAPHENSSQPQADSCAVCPKNRFPGNGEPKECKNIKRLGLISADVKPEDIAGTDVLYLKTPVTSGKNWAAYVKALSAMFQRPPFGVITEISTKPDPKSQFKVHFKPIQMLGPEYMEPILRKREMVRETICFPYQPLEELPAEDSKKF